MKVLNYWKKFWNFLKEDSWQSWIVSLLLALVIIKFIFFPLFSFVMASPLPLVVVESCSMYHATNNFDLWWEQNEPWYQKKDIQKGDFREFPFRNGLNKGDLVLVTGRGNYELGDVIIFESEFRFPLIHRIVELDPIGTKGDNNFDQLTQEKAIAEDQILGKAIIRVPFVGWIKLIFFEPFRTSDGRGFCN